MQQSNVSLCLSGRRGCLSLQRQGVHSSITGRTTTGKMKFKEVQRWLKSCWGHRDCGKEAGAGKTSSGTFAVGYRTLVKVWSWRPVSYGSWPRFSDCSQVLSALTGRNTFSSALENHSGCTPGLTISWTLSGPWCDSPLSWETVFSYLSVCLTTQMWEPQNSQVWISTSPRISAFGKKRRLRLLFHM